MKHKPGCDHKIFDALSRLLTKPPVQLKSLEIEALHGTLIELSNGFQKELKKGYKAQKSWQAVLEVLNAIDKRHAIAFSIANTSGHPENCTPAHCSIDFELREGLIFHVDKSTSQRKLCIPKSIEKEVFNMGHDQNAHAGLDQALLHISETLYIWKLRNYLRAYISHCPECQLNQIRCHFPYGSLNPISTPNILFHTIAMDFILALPVKGPEHYNALLTVLCKFSKARIFIPGRDDYSAADWAIFLVTYLCFCN